MGADQAEEAETLDTPKLKRKHCSSSSTDLTAARSRRRESGILSLPRWITDELVDDAPEGPDCVRADAAALLPSFLEKLLFQNREPGRSRPFPLVEQQSLLSTRFLLYSRPRANGMCAHAAKGGVAQQQVEVFWLLGTEPQTANTLDQSSPPDSCVHPSLSPLFEVVWGIFIFQVLHKLRKDIGRGRSFVRVRLTGPSHTVLLDSGRVHRAQSSNQESRVVALVEVAPQIDTLSLPS